MVAQSPVRKDGSRIIFRANARRQIVGCMSLLAGLVGFVAAAAVAIVESSSLLWLFAGHYGLLVLVGGFLWLRRDNTTFDLATGEVSSSRIQCKVSDLLAVELAQQRPGEYSRKNTKRARWRVGLVASTVHSDVGTLFDSGAKSTLTEAASLVAANPMVVARSTDAAYMARAAMKLASSLGVPLLERHDDGASLTRGTDVGLPIPERRSYRYDPEAEAAKPDGINKQQQDGDTVYQWKLRNRGLIYALMGMTATAVILAAVVVLGAALFGKKPGGALNVIFLAVMTSICSLQILRFCGATRLVLTRDAVCAAGGFGIKLRQSIPCNEVVWVGWDTNMGGALVLLGQGTLMIRASLPPGARWWIASEIREHLSNK
jgi:hypothetical protein